MGVHFIRLTDIQVAYLYNVLSAWEGEFEGVRGNNRTDFVKSLQEELLDIFPHPDLANQDHMEAHSEEYQESEEHFEEHEIFIPTTVFGYPRPDVDEHGRVGWLMNKVIEVNGWFNV